MSLSVRLATGALAGFAALTLYVLGGLGLQAWMRRRAVRRFRSAYAHKGKDTLLVYSSSPHWERYVEEHWLPRWGERAVVLNWSERARWSTGGSAEAALFFAVGGTREFNPLAVVVDDAGGVTVVRFWRAFRDLKHGKDASLRACERALEVALASSHGRS